MADDLSVRDRLRAALAAAMRERDRVATSAYRTALAALDNAEAVAAPDAAGSEVQGPIAGAAVGAFATEVPRRALTAVEERAVLRAEIADRRHAADDYAGDGRPSDALRLWAEADLLEAMLAQ